MNTETKNKIKSLQSQIQDLKKEQVEVFKTGLKELLETNSEIKILKLD